MELPARLLPFFSIIERFRISRTNTPVRTSAPPSSTGVSPINDAPQQKEKHYMDPSMGEMTAGVTAPGASGYLGGPQEMAADQGGVTTSEPVVEVAKPATNYPVGVVDFNKPIVVFDPDSQKEHIAAAVVMVLNTNRYPVVVRSTDADGDEVVNQFDTDGDNAEGTLKVENIGVPRIKYGVLLRDNSDGKYSLSDELFDTESEANSHDDNYGLQRISVFPVNIPARGASAVSDDGATEEQEHEDVVVEDVIPEGSTRVNGRVYAPGDKVYTYRSNFGRRLCTVIKTRNDPFKSLFVAPEDGSNPYWALNKNVNR